MEIDNYQNIISYLNKKKRRKHLLLGNGFSMSYDKKIFSYNAFSNFIKKTDNQLLRKLFGIIKTCNFELIMSQLDVFYQLAVEFVADKGLADKITIATKSLKEKLVDAISELHPEQVFKIPGLSWSHIRIRLKLMFKKSNRDMENTRESSSGNNLQLKR
ncbi:MAG: DUF4917 family protein [Candidatus Scalindua rubra]|uniref:DUF4917 family protein n=1 Tax=Candidatus Scalindua brodae TaxID=237368 RepID=A0A0B0EHM7_9BACT|nr:MAG: hypothetical protein SCABRO_02124 [Candidatus Scalindua brodae]MBZ0107319.1 DUF4917 family protein [Candidatus Scalindua rubra]TWU31484.1 hypothetical protein S225a_21570 [Candidatus Brocadiaceae bacterium S225]